MPKGRYRQNYSLYKRRMSDGSFVYYYRTYDLDGKKTSGRSTYQKNKILARNYCDELLKAGKLIPSSSTTFRRYASGFFRENGKYKNHIAPNKVLAKNTLMARNNTLEKRVIPYFGDTELCSFTRNRIVEFQKYLLGEGLSSLTVNACLTVLRFVLESAVEDGLISVNPCEHVKQVYTTSKSHDSFTVEECKRLIHHEWHNWYGQMAFIIGCFTGMRFSEILAIRDETIHEGYIEVKDQLCRGELKCTKTKQERIVPMCPEFEKWLRSEKCRAFAVPINDNRITYECHLAFDEAGIENWKKRKISFHSTRHFFNTYLMSTIPGCEQKIAAVLGHKVGITKIQGLYTNFKPDDFKEIIEAQSKLWKLIMDEGLAKGLLPE